MSEGVKFEMEEISCLIVKLVLFDERVQRSGDVFGIQGVAEQEALTVVTVFVLECWKEPPLGVFFRSVLLLHPCNLCENDGGYLFGNRDFMPKHMCLLDVSNKRVLMTFLFSTAIDFQVFYHRTTQTLCS